MRIVGHANYQTTVNIYTHIQEQQIQDSTADLASMLEPGNLPNPNPFDEPRFGLVFRATFRQLFFCIILPEMKPNGGKSTVSRSVIVIIYFKVLSQNAESQETQGFS